MGFFDKIKELLGIRPPEDDGIEFALGLSEGKESDSMDKVLMRETVRRSDLNDNEESRISYLLATRMTMHQEQYDKLLLRHGYEEDFLAKVDKRMEQSRFSAEHSPYKDAMDKIRQLKGSGQINDYYKAIDETLSEWKQEYRRNMNATAGVM